MTAKPFVINNPKPNGCVKFKIKSNSIALYKNIKVDFNLVGNIFFKKINNFRIPKKLN